MWWFCGIFVTTVPHTNQVGGSGANVSYHFVENLVVVVPSLVIVGLLVRPELLLTEAFLIDGVFFVAMVL